MCNQRERLMDYLYDEAAPAERRVVETHLETCDDCRDEVRAFRRVREDLLAWDVPQTPSVWTPFATTATPPWYRQMPAWAMTAAAGLMFLFGTAGGYAAMQLASPAAAAPQVAERANPAVPAPPVTAAPVRDVAPVQVSIKDDEVLALVRTELARIERGRTSAQGRDTEALVADAATRHWAQVYEYLTTAAKEREMERKEYDRRMTQLQMQLNDVLDAYLRLTAQTHTKGIQ